MGCLAGSFVCLAIGGAIIERIASESTQVTVFVVLLGVALLIVGFGIFGSQWAGKDAGKTLEIGPRWSVILTFVTTVIVAIWALWAYSANDIIWTAVGVGALGGLVHEISQSKGTAFLPDTTSSGQGGGGAGSNDTESYLGGLLGLILGGAAGFLTLSAVSASATVSVQFVVAAFSAGAAFKGIADAAASPSKTSSTKKDSDQTATLPKPDTGAEVKAPGVEEKPSAV
ncbi:MAG TPA: hypothetical protein VEC08_00975 [Nitrososphaerales archaeon]|nr:hypothetical protein [Nitrososphaerales archaeon]